MKSFWLRALAATMSAWGSPEAAPPRMASPDASVTDTLESATAAPAWPGVRIGAAPRVMSAASAPAARRKEAADMEYLRKTRARATLLGHRPGASGGYTGAPSVLTCQNRTY